MSDKETDKKKKKSEKETDGSKFVETEPTIDEESIEEVLSVSQRRARGRAMKKNKAKIRIGRKKAEKRRAGAEKLKGRAKKKALAMIKDKLAGKKAYSNLSPSEKVAVDKKLAKIPSSRVERIAKKLLPSVKQTERERLSSKTKKEDLDIETLEAITENFALNENFLVISESRIIDRIFENMDDAIAEGKEFPLTLVAHKAIEEHNLSITKKQFLEIYQEECGLFEIQEANGTCQIITRKQMIAFEKVVDKLFKSFDIDFSFTKHFSDRMSDERNKPCIDMKDLAMTFKKLYQKVKASGGKTLAQFKNAEVVIKDLQQALNLPIVVKYDRKNDEIDVVMKTIMRKKDFKTPNDIVRV